MNKKIEEMFKDLPQNDAVGIFMQFIELPDDQFDFAWQILKHLFNLLVHYKFLRLHLCKFHL